MNMRNQVKVLMSILIAITSSWSIAQTTRSTIDSAETSFKYIATSLQVFRTTGRLVNNPGIDGADLEAYIELLDTYYEEFSSGFGSDSSMCKFYLDPDNGRMTIEDKAELSFSFLRSLEDRIALYIEIDAEFQDTVVQEFGSFVMRNINEAKVTTLSNQRLPSTDFDEAAVISFIDTMCI